MKKLILALITVALLPAALNAAVFAKVGTAGLQFLKLGVDARAIGMGEAYTPVSDDISSMYWNPAGLAIKEEDQVMLSHTEWPADIKHEYLAYSKYFDFATFGISASYLHMDDMDVTTEENFGPNGEKFTCSDLAVGLTYSSMFTDKFSFGLTAKYLREELDDYSVDGFAFDVGTRLNTLWRNVTIGMAMRNFGPDLKYEVDNDNDGQTDEDPFDLLDNDGDGRVDEDREEMEFKIPMQFSFGISGDLYRKDETYLLASFQIDNVVDREETFNLGFEGRYSVLLLRAGVQFNYDTSDGDPRPTFGFGVLIPTRIAVVHVDYAYTNMGYLEESFIESAHRMSLKLMF